MLQSQCIDMKRMLVTNNCLLSTHTNTEKPEITLDKDVHHLCSLLWVVGKKHKKRALICSLDADTEKK